MATLGDTTVEGSTDVWPQDWVAAFGVSGAAGGYQMSEDGTLLNININLVCPGVGDPTVLPVVYNDSSLLPASVFATFDPITVTAGAAAAWYQSGNPTATALLNGHKYWLGFLVSSQPGTGLSVTCKTSGAPSSSCYYNNTGSNTVPSPFPGSPSTTAEVASIYLNYTSVSGSTPKSDSDSVGSGADAYALKAVIQTVD